MRVISILLLQTEICIEKNGDDQGEHRCNDGHVASRELDCKLVWGFREVLKRKPSLHILMTQIAMVLP
jgi:hypothetical protein